MNVDIVRKHFSYITPCGHAGLKMTQISGLLKTPNGAEQHINTDLKRVGEQLGAELSRVLGYTHVTELQQ